MCGQALQSPVDDRPGDDSHLPAHAQQRLAPVGVQVAEQLEQRADFLAGQVPEFLRLLHERTDDGAALDYPEHAGEAAQQRRGPFALRCAPVASQRATPHEVDGGLPRHPASPFDNRGDVLQGRAGRFAEPGAALLPAWRTATREPDEAMR